MQHPSIQHPTYHDAARRCPVRLPDGRTARVVYVPRKGGQLCTVVFASGAHLNVKRHELLLLPEQP